MHEIVCTSANVSPTNIFGSREGSGLPEIRRLVDPRRHWEEKSEYPWPLIKREWLRYWDTAKPLLLDKSPANLIRAESIREHFKPSSFIVMTRNPYAHCERLMRRNGMTPEAAAHFSMKCLRHQKRNAERLEHRCVIRYEDLVLDARAIQRKLLQFIPELEGVVVNKVFTAPNSKHQRLPITDFNRESIARLTAWEISRLNRVFGKDAGAMAYFGYELGPVAQF
jgi:hypothetical protein